MNRVRVLVEGDTEASFVDYILCPEFATKDIFLYPTLFRKKHKGSFGYQNCQKIILNSLKQDVSVYVTIYVDFYKLPMDWPGRTESESCQNYQDKAQKIEQTLSEDIIAQMGNSWNPVQFIPYVQMHEFEALLFSDTAVLAEHTGQNNLHQQFQNIKQSFSCPEEINDNEQTHPLKRIITLFPGYQKVLDGINIAQKIGLAKIRSECPHFNKWIEKLEKLGD